LSANDEGLIPKDPEQAIKIKAAIENFNKTCGPTFI
jgi:hypothetical protein